MFSQPWGEILRQCAGGHEPSILLSECSFGLGEAGDFHFETLVDNRIRVVIAPFFGPALVSEAVRCNVLLAPLPLPVIESLGASLTREPNAELQFDLKAQQITLPDGNTIPFETHPWLRTRLLHGMDNLDEQLRHRDSAQKFRTEDRRRNPWLYRGDDENNSA